MLSQNLYEIIMSIYVSKSYGRIQIKSKPIKLII